MIGYRRAPSVCPRAAAALLVASQGLGVEHCGCILLRSVTPLAFVCEPLAPPSPTPAPLPYSMPALLGDTQGRSSSPRPPAAAASTAAAAPTAWPTPGPRRRCRPGLPAGRPCRPARPATAARGGRGCSPARRQSRQRTRMTSGASGENVKGAGRLSLSSRLSTCWKWGKGGAWLAHRWSWRWKGGREGGGWYGPSYIYGAGAGLRRHWRVQASCGDAGCVAWVLGVASMVHSCPYSLITLRVVVGSGRSSAAAATAPLDVEMWPP